MNNKIWADETDAALHDAATRYVADRYRFETRQRLSREERRFSASVWHEVAEMGWLSVATPEAEGGLGLRVASICLLAEMAGRALMTEPLTNSGVLAPYLVSTHASAAQREALLPAMHAGKLRMACLLDGTEIHHEAGHLTGSQRIVVDADVSDHLLVSSDGALWLADASDASVTRRSFALLDGRGAATVHLENTPAVWLGDHEKTDVQFALLLAALTTAADSHGAMSAAFDLTLDYLKTRQQFGKPLGTYQALQHRAVDMYIALGESRAVLDQAIESLHANSPNAARDVHAAKALIGESARRVTQEAVQLHGGIGVTEEYAASHYLRRARVNEQLWGSAEQHFLAFAAAAPAII